MIIENEKLYNQTPRLIQIIFLLYYLEGFKNQYGLILEVLSGEGKTLIISFLALYFAIFGKKVDTLINSPVLAERDTKIVKIYITVLELLAIFAGKILKILMKNVFLNVIMQMLFMEMDST